MSALNFVVLSTGLGSFKELRDALAADERTRLLAGGDDAALRYVERLSAECPQTAIICASRDASPDLILRSLRAGAREFLRLPLNPEEFKTVLGRVGEFCAVQTEAPKKRGRTVAVFSSKGGCGTTFIAANVAATI